MKPWFAKSLNEFNKYKKFNRLPHALIISGNKSIGKLEFAQIIVAKLVQTEITQDNLQISTNELLIRHSHANNVVYCQRETRNKKLANNINVDQIRAFNSYLNRTSNGLQVGIIKYADELNNNAANALLKTLEEPRANTLIILLTHNIKLLPITIVSRCQQIHISADHNASSWILANITTKITQDELNDLLEQNNFAPQTVVNKINNGEYVVEQQLREKLINIACKPDSINIITKADSLELTINCLEYLVIDILRYKASKQNNNNNSYGYLISNTNMNFLLLLLNDIYYAKHLLTTTINKNMLIDSLLIIWSHITQLKKYPTIFNQVKY